MTNKTAFFATPMELDDAHFHKVFSSIHVELHERRDKVLPPTVKTFHHH